MHRSRISQILSSRSLCLGLIFLGMFLVVAGVRIFLIENYGIPVPFLDEWIIELPFLQLLLQGDLEFAALWAPANEHRMFWPRLLSLALFRLNEFQWDPSLQMLANAGFSAAMFVIAGAAMTHGLNDPVRLAVLGGITLIAVQPWDWFSVLWGIQTLSYMLVLLSVAGLCLVAVRPLKSWGFALGVLLLLNAHLTMGSGFMAAGCAAVLFLWRALVQPPGAEPPAVQLIKFGVCAAVAGLVVFVRAEQSMGLASRGLSDFLVSLTLHLVFPFSLNFGTQTVTWLGILIPLPILLLALIYLLGLRRDCPERSRVELCLLLAGWFLAQFGILALLRGEGGQGPALRHLQIHQLWLTVCLVSLFWCLRLIRQGQVTVPAWLKDRAAPAAGVYLLILVTGSIQLTAASLSSLKTRIAMNHERFQHVTAFVRTGDPQHLVTRKFPQLPLTRGEELHRILRNPNVQAILPAGVRAPKNPTESESADATGFAPEYLPPKTTAPPHTRTYGSYAETQAAHTGSLVLGPMRSLYSHLGLLVAGNSDDPEISLMLVSADGETVRIFHPLKPTSPFPIPGQKWRFHVAETPAETFFLVVNDHSARGWIAITQPTEIARASIGGQKLLYNWLNLVFLGGLAMLLGIFCMVQALVKGQVAVAK